MVEQWILDSIKAKGYSTYEEYLAKVVYPQSKKGTILGDTYTSVLNIDEGRAINPTMARVLELYPNIQEVTTERFEDFWDGWKEIKQSLISQFSGTPSGATPATIGTVGGATAAANATSGSNVLKYIPLVAGVGLLGLALMKKD
ncbi:MAG: hypothetical protein KO464_07215 [Candidatus Methanofastidiosum sp.]|nr:hypothetical protein [Methanofastidiosum sp.]